ncbi:MAG: pyridoxamine 5'-phosphate oxidase family protein [Actinomycetota bacterium]|nr:pyridoxamine 5'-phosphate oxidase family protein [Actinomycetota bacterium]
MEPKPTFDARFSAPEASPLPWEDVQGLLGAAELYWLTTVRADGRPHVTPLVGVQVGGAMHFVTGLSEQKARNLEHSPRVALTTGTNTWARGTDVVVEGTAVRVTDDDALREVKRAYDVKYAGDWTFEVGDGVFHHGEARDGAVFRIEPSKVMAFAKDPHGQTTFRFPPQA